jgi:hypothetical protein
MEARNFVETRSFGLLSPVPPKASFRAAKAVPGSLLTGEKEKRKGSLSLSA